MTQFPFQNDKFRIIASIDAIDRRLLFAGLFLLDIVIAWLDRISGSFMPFMSMYLLTIMIAGFFLSKYYAYIFALLTSFTGLATYLHLGVHSYPYRDMTFHNFVSHGVVYFIVIWLMVKVRQLFDYVSILAVKDASTDLYNGRGFLTLGAGLLASANRYNEPLSMVYIDLDNFKQVNDTYGHRVGDKLIATIAYTLSTRVRQGDIVGRLGGDELGILMPKATTEAAKILVTRLQVDMLQAIDKYNTNISFSIGVVTCKSTCTITIDNLVGQADKLMYTIKNTTKNGVAYANAICRPREN